MNKTIRVLQRVAVVHMLNAFVVAGAGFAGWQYVRLWIWVAREFHKTPGVSWSSAIRDSSTLGAAVAVFLGFLFFWLYPVVTEYFTDTWRVAERDVDVETEASTAARDTLLRGSDGRQTP